MRSEHLDTLLLVHVLGDWPIGVHAQTRRAISSYTRYSNGDVLLEVIPEIASVLKETHSTLKTKALLEDWLGIRLYLDQTYKNSKANGIRFEWVVPNGTLRVVIYMDGTYQFDISECELNLTFTGNIHTWDTVARSFEWEPFVIEAGCEGEDE